MNTTLCWQLHRSTPTPLSNVPTAQGAAVAAAAAAAAAAHQCRLLLLLLLQLLCLNVQLLLLRARLSQDARRHGLRDVGLRANCTRCTAWHAGLGVAVLSLWAVMVVSARPAAARAVAAAAHQPSGTWTLPCACRRPRAACAACRHVAASAGSSEAHTADAIVQPTHEPLATTPLEPMQAHANSRRAPARRALRGPASAPPGPGGGALAASAASCCPWCFAGGGRVRWLAFCRAAAGDCRRQQLLRTAGGGSTQRAQERWARAAVAVITRWWGCDGAVVA
jgi:hypothetical protein